MTREYKLRDDDGETACCYSCGSPAPTAEFEWGPPPAAEFTMPPDCAPRLLCEFCFMTGTSLYTEYPPGDEHEWIKAEIRGANATLFNALKFGLYPVAVMGVTEDGAAWEKLAREVVANPRPISEIKRDIAGVMERIDRAASGPSVLGQVPLEHFELSPQGDGLLASAQVDDKLTNKGAEFGIGGDVVAAPQHDIQDGKAEFDIHPPMVLPPGLARADASEALVLAIQEHIDGWKSATFGWQGDPDPAIEARNREAAVQAHAAECIRRIRATLAYGAVVGATQKPTWVYQPSKVVP